MQRKTQTLEKQIQRAESDLIAGLSVKSSSNTSVAPEDISQYGQRQRFNGQLKTALKFDSRFDGGYLWAEYMDVMVVAC